MLLLLLLHCATMQYCTTDLRLDIWISLAILPSRLVPTPQPERPQRLGVNPRRVPDVSIGFPAGV